MKGKAKNCIMECLWALEEKTANPDTALILKLIVLILWGVVIVLSRRAKEGLGTLSLWMTVVLGALTIKVERNKEKKAD